MFAILQFENLERASVSLLMLSSEQGNHWYHFFNVFGMTRPLAGTEPGTWPALEAGTLPMYMIALTAIVVYSPLFYLSVLINSDELLVWIKQ